MGVGGEGEGGVLRGRRKRKSQEGNHITGFMIIITKYKYSVE